jgi:hypothetical protein
MRLFFENLRAQRAVVVVAELEVVLPIFTGENKGNEDEYLHFFLRFHGLLLLNGKV